MTTQERPDDLKVMLDPNQWPGQKITLPLKNNRDREQGAFPRLGVLVNLSLAGNHKADIRFCEGNMFLLSFDDFEKAPSLGPTEIAVLVADGWVVD